MKDSNLKPQRPTRRRIRRRSSDPWREYEREKAIIAETSETQAEYDQRIRELIDRLGI